MTILEEFSNAAADLAATVTPRLALVRLRHGRHLTATHWRDDLFVVSEQALPARDAFPVLVGGSEAEASLVGRDDGSNIAVLKVAGAGTVQSPRPGALRVGGLAVAVGVASDGGATARLATVVYVGPAWHSMRGGQIDAFIDLGVSLTQGSEGGPVIAPDGGIAGISTFGPRGRVIVIPNATVERIVPILAERRRMPRGWLGVALQPVAVPDGVDAARRGLMVMGTEEASPARAAGLRSGDVILAVDGVPLGPSSRLTSRLGPDGIGKPIELKLLRGGEVTAASLTVVERPEP